MYHPLGARGNHRLLPGIQDVHVVVLVENELPSSLLLHLSHPIWQRRITVLIGSPLRLADLNRARWVEPGAREPLWVVHALLVEPS